MKNLNRTIRQVKIIAEEFTKRGWTLGIAESCTGGLLGHLITEFPGASGFFKGGIVSYDNDVKRHLLGVKAKTLKVNGAVSQPTVREMAHGTLNKLSCDCAVAISGIAGPGGGTSHKPVGTVCIGWASTEEAGAECFLFIGSRSEIKTQAAEKALEIIIEELISKN